MNIRKLLQNSILFFSYFFAFFLILATFWVKRFFGEVSFEQLLYQFKFGAENFFESDSSIISSFFKNTVLSSFTLSASLVYWKKIALFIKCCAKKINAHFIQPTQKYIASTRVKKYRIFLLMFASVSFTAYQFSFISFIKDQVLSNHHDFYAERYIDPNSIKIAEKQPKNLILIYVEALENSYENPKLFRLNLIENIQPDAIGGQSFNAQKQLPGTGWTMAGVVATQCGVPLKTAIGGDTGEGKHKILEKMNSFLPSIECMGDILKQHGYLNIFMGGASLNYAGKGLFFKSHGYDELYGREEILRANQHKIPTNTWGIYDDDLLKFALKRIETLQAEKKRFNLTLLTVDTHLPNGHISATCKDRGVTEFKGIVKCTAEITAEFINKLKEKGYLENTTVVIMGDHLAMMNPEIKKLHKIKNRYIFNNYITNDDSLIKTRENFIHFDHFPTILDSIGFHVEGGKLGLGISGFYDGTLPNFDTRFDEYNKNIMRSSIKYQAFWAKKSASD